jgi:hypothetical protein
MCSCAPPSLLYLPCVKRLVITPFFPLYRTKPTRAESAAGELGAVDPLSLGQGAPMSSRACLSLRIQLQLCTRSPSRSTQRHQTCLSQRRERCTRRWLVSIPPVSTKTPTQPQSSTQSLNLEQIARQTPPAYPHLCHRLWFSEASSKIRLLVILMSIFVLRVLHSTASGADQF